MKHIRLSLILLLPLLSGAGPVENPESALRQGDAAAAREDFKTAIDKFDLALKRTTDPAPAAFNLAVAHLRQALSLPDPASAERKRQLLEAEALFASFTGGNNNNNDPNSRRTLALYGLGVCRLQRAEAGDLEAARAAVGSLRECLQDPALEPALRADVRHNLARARLLAWQLTPPTEASQPEDQHGDGHDPRPQKNPQDPSAKPEPGDSSDPKHGDPTGTPPNEGDPRNAKARTHGHASLPTIPDDVEPTPLTPEEAAIYLEKAVKAMQVERLTRQPTKSASETRKGVRDW